MKTHALMIFVKIILASVGAHINQLQVILALMEFLEIHKPLGQNRREGTAAGTPFCCKEESNNLAIQRVRWNQLSNAVVDLFWQILGHDRICLAREKRGT
jgi:hypothetical protein